ncbi:MAG: hypothetical protein IJU79_02315 [Desulfovibrionaceae bacterium]|nr:hypothetical protein [Desulfovibrionaceae bacterium]
MTDDVRVKGLTGSQAALLVPQLWHGLTPHRRRYMVWDAADQHGPETLARFVSLANVACAAWVNGQFLGLAWVIPLTYGSRCGLIHMASTGPRWQSEAIGNIWIRDVLPYHYDSLLAFLPVAFRHIRAMIEDMGFVRISTIPGAACLTMRNNRIMDAIMYQKDLRHGHQ